MNFAGLTCRHDALPIEPGQLLTLLPQVPGWGVEGHHLARVFAFDDFHQTMRFVDALAAMIHVQDHHPVLTVSYQHCKVSFTTHSTGNTISTNDFICAARANALYDQQAGA